MEPVDEGIAEVSRSFNSVPPNGGRSNMSQDAVDRFKRGLTPTPIKTADGTLGEEVDSMKAKRLAKRERAKKERQRWDDADYD